MTMLYTVTGNDVVRLQETARGWRVEVLLRAVGAQCVAVDPHDGQTLLAGTFDQGLFLSVDGGRTWRRAETLPASRVLSVAISPSWRVDGRGVLFAGCEPSALFWSEDGGRRWHEAVALRALPSAPTWSFPPRPWTSHVRAIALSPDDPGLVLVGIELGGVLRSTDGGLTWVDRRPGCSLDCHALLLHPAAPELVYEAAGGGVAVSHDAGDTWQSADDGLDRRYVWALATPPDDPLTWFVSAAPGPREAHGPGPHREARPNPAGAAQARIFRRYGSEPWRPVEGLPDPLPSMPYALLVPPAEPRTLYAGFRDGTLWRGLDLGASWQPLPVRLDAVLTFAAAPA
ncbi:hypothetical protein OO015_06130 [Thermomicrobium sp. 4228-Ro]|uniref:WD40/YVTN/BNR-like repeat-containing protein n=1 Tax=Thermomicrobium sp. 4228-Ro TaxID=2993937 RepID=UPI0022496947|nr:hypothetical protein [Thermomicrobium sp. 4228-Ro]MCX2727073.1 hypothetical protein [Thermomicrobium sp. 4228-Ro]